jgi:DNA-binding LacI/PurR family transcriptional regulator
VHVPICELGARAAELLLHGITHKNDHERRRERMPTELVIRRSTSAEPVERPPPTFSRKMITT